MTDTKKPKDIGWFNYANTYLRAAQELSEIKFTQTEG
jgi:hypothetical protein